MNEALRLERVGKAYGEEWAVQDLSFAVPVGSLFGLLGPNGAGKTTTIRLAMGILLPDAGEIAVLGMPPAGDVRARLGYLPEERGLYEAMKIGELLVFLARLKGVATAEGKRRARRGLEEVGLGDAYGRKLRELSKGNQQKIQFLATILHEPELVLLDEPFAGLDPMNSQVLLDMLLRIHRSGRTVILSSHRMDQVEKLCSGMALISRGRLVLEGDIRAIKRERGTDAVRVEFAEPAPAPEGWPGVTGVRADGDGRRYLLALEPEADTNALLARALALGRVERFERVEPSLEEIFVAAVGRSIAEDEAHEEEKKRLRIEKEREREARRGR